MRISLIELSRTVGQEAGQVAKDCDWVLMEGEVIHLACEVRMKEEAQFLK